MLRNNAYTVNIQTGHRMMGDKKLPTREEMLREYLEATPEEREFATMFYGRDPFQEDAEKVEDKEIPDMAIYGKCPNCGKDIYERYFEDEVADYLVGREICGACNKGCIDFVVHVLENDIVQDVLSDCCHCGKRMLKDV